MTTGARPLDGRGILITRPAGQAEGLAGRIAALGGTPVRFPALVIAPPSNPEALSVLVAGLSGFDWAVFVSPTSVERFFASLPADWPAGVSAAAVGGATARALHERGLGQVLVADGGADSESLMALPAFADVRGKQVVIVRGEGGREMIADTLRTRGATVTYAECYRRARPDVDAGPLIERWCAGGVAAVTVTSREVFANLADLLGEAGADLLRHTPLFAPHPRIADAARQWGVLDTMVTPPGDDGLVAALADWFNDRHG